MEPTSSPRGAGRNVAFLVFLVCLVGMLAGVLAGGACYDPQIKSGAYACGPNDLCPSGFTCRAGACISGAGVGGAGGTSGTGGAGGSGGACANPITPLCAGAPMSPCDPVCQTGCGCGLRCSFNGTTFACVVPAGAKTEGQVCGATVDDCAPGFVCLQEACGTNLRRCHRSCTTANSQVCLHTACNSTGLPGVMACTLPPEPCNPYASPGSNDCSAPELACFTDGFSSTYCECPPAVGIAEGEPCTLLTTCAPGLVCLQPFSSSSQCYRLCQPAAPPPSCNCMSYGSIGYCK